MRPRNFFRVVTAIEDVLGRRPAHTGADRHARAILLALVEPETRILHGLRTGDERELRKSIEHINRYTCEMFVGIEVGNFRGDLNAEDRGIAEAYAAGPAARGHQALPKGAEADTHRRD